MTPPTLAVDIGGSKIAAAVVAEGGIMGTPATRATPAQEGREAIIATVLDLAREMVSAAERQVGEVGISTAGIVEPRTGRITHATDLLRGWAGTRLGDRVGRELRLPVAVLGDVHAHGVGEALAGAARGYHCALVVAVGTGIGGCLVVDGLPEVGARGAAGHVGHVPVPEAADLQCSCGRSGHLEALASGAGVRAAFTRRTGHDLTAAQIAGLSASSDGNDESRRVALAVLTEAGRATGRVLGGLLNVLDPEVVVIGGGMAAAGAAWRGAIADGMALEAMDAVAGTPLRFSAAGPESALLGAAHHARTALRPTTEEIHDR